MVSRAASHQTFTDSINQLNMEMIRDPVVADLWLRGKEGRSDLDPNERHRFDTLMLSFFHVFETLFYQSQVGAGDRHLAAAEERSLTTMLSTTGIGEWWLANPYSFSEEFRQYVESFVPRATSAADGA